MSYYIEQISYQEYKRYCKVLRLKADDALIAKYVEAHRPENIWPEINQGMKEVGILDMEIYKAGDQLFMIMDTISDFEPETAMANLATKPRQAEWEAYMAQFQDTRSEATADEKWQPVERIYKLD